jgi:phosphoserine phosphatase
VTDLDLVTFDLDGTLLEGTAFQAVARGEGFAETVEAIDERFFAGEITLEECFRETWELLEGRDAKRCREHVREAPGVDGLDAAVDRLHEAGVDAGILTDQPIFLAEAVADGGLDVILGSDAEVRDGTVTGAIDARFDKRAHLEALLEAADLAPEAVGHVGNGHNDVPVFDLVGRSVAANPDDGELASAADVVVDPFEDASDAVEALLEQAT